jgi:hypothetical protein
LNEKSEEKLMKHLEVISSSLEKIALFRALDALYPSPARARLVAEYDALMRADTEAFADLEAASRAAKEGGLGWDALVEKFGEEEARRKAAPATAAREKRGRTMADVDQFRKRHPLIKELVQFYPVALAGAAADQD